MAHPLVLGLFEGLAPATDAARAVHAVGIPAERLSVVARDHDEEGVLARSLGASPGVEIEDSRRAGRLGELGGYLLAAVAVGAPGLGALLTAGPLAAEFGEVAGRVGGSLAGVLRDAGLDEALARAWEDRVQQGAIILAVHADEAEVDAVRGAFERAAATIAVARWQ